MCMLLRKTGQNPIIKLLFIKKKKKPHAAHKNHTRKRAKQRGRSEKAAEVPSCAKFIQSPYPEGGDQAAAMADQFADSANNVIIEEVNKGMNPGMIVLLVVAGFLLLFFVGNYALYMYAQKTLPPKKKKPVSKKKLKREKLKQGVSAPGE
ncbi:DNA-binding protein S1FA2-like [Phragmites australis]|uniref:DNA-binding protein S1FA2-like n=1 Tax=Phragmites australis TaxID=29695 RepID=UPI002D76DF2F|nr:DNA-binding protein S1FA2-like [Phragmites australis]